MNVQCYELHGTRVAQLASIGDALRTDKQAIEIISAASACQPELIIIPVERLSEDFLNLKTRVARRGTSEVCNLSKAGRDFGRHFHAFE